MWNSLIKVIDDPTLEGFIREHAAMLLRQLNTASKSSALEGEIHSFLIQHSTGYLQTYMGALVQLDVDGSHTWFKYTGDTLTISRGPQNLPIVESIDGAWSQVEIDMAKYLYPFTEAAKR